MVLIPATTLPAQGALAPRAPRRDEEKGASDEAKKGKGPGSGDDEPAEQPEQPDEKPASNPTTTVPAFRIDVHEVSARAYAACVSEGKCTAAGTGAGCTIEAGLEDHPVTCVSIDQARAFCAARGKRLLRNDEWTAAAAGAELRPYPWGSASPAATLLNMGGEADGWKTTAPRGSFPEGRSPQGVADLAGNVAEWVDVTGATIARGGSHADVELAAVSSLALRTSAAIDATTGFRCAKDP